MLNPDQVCGFTPMPRELKSMLRSEKAPRKKVHTLRQVIPGKKPTIGFWNSPVRALWESKTIHTHSLLVPSSPYPVTGGQFYSEPDSPYTRVKTRNAGFLNKEAQEAEEILQWKCGLKTQNHLEQNGKSVFIRISEDPSCQWNV